MAHSIGRRPRPHGTPVPPAREDRETFSPSSDRGARDEQPRPRLPPSPPTSSGPGEAPLDAIFAPRSVAVIGATEKAGSVGRTILWNLVGSPFGGTVYPGQPEAAERAGDQGLPEHRRRARAGRPGGHRHARADGAGRHRRVRRGRRARGDRHLGRLQGDRRRRASSWSARSWSRRGGAGCGSSARTAWA